MSTPSNSSPPVDSSHDSSSTSKAATSTTTSADTHTVRVWDGDAWHSLTVADKANLWEVLCEHDLQPQGRITSVLNCQGRGHCATCAVGVEGAAPEPDQWLDALLAGSGGGRLSCQMEVDRDLTVRVG